ncbi:leucine zipper domain-containing protein, partial [Streptomyces sp. NPDC091266]
MSHRNARLTVFGRRLLVERVRCGRPVAHVATEMGISRVTAHKWVRRWRDEGEAGLCDRSSRPLTTPHRTPAGTESQVCRLRQERKLGPARIGPILGLPASTVHRILTRHSLNRLAFLDR